MARRKAFVGSLPDGSPAAAERQYVDKWRAFAKNVAGLFGGKAYAYDPGVSVFLPGDRIEHFSQFVARRLNEIADTMKSQEFELHMLRRKQKPVCGHSWPDIRTSSEGTSYCAACETARVGKCDKQGPGKSGKCRGWVHARPNGWLCDGHA